MEGRRKEIKLERSHLNGFSVFKILHFCDDGAAKNLLKET